MFTSNYIKFVKLSNPNRFYFLINSEHADFRWVFLSTLHTQCENKSSLIGFSALFPASFFKQHNSTKNKTSHNCYIQLYPLSAMCNAYGVGLAYPTNTITTSKLTEHFHSMTRYCERNTHQLNHSMNTDLRMDFWMRRTLHPAFLIFLTMSRM